MVAFGHTGVGTLIGIASYQVFGKGDIALGLIATGALGVLSHYLMDLIPHGHFFKDQSYSKYILLVILFDLFLPVLFILGLAHFLEKSGTEILYILFGIGGAQLPDILEGLRRMELLPKGGILRWENKLHISTHWHGINEKLLMFSVFDIWQAAVFIAAVAVLIY